MKANTSLEVALDVRDMISMYQGREINRMELKNYIDEQIKTNNRKLFNADQLSPTLTNKLGKNRVNVFNSILDDIESDSM